MTARPAAGGGRWVSVPPSRLSKWIAGFRARHGSVTVAPTSSGFLTLVGSDGDTATFYPAPGLVVPACGASLLDLDAFVAAAAAPRLLGFVLARRNAVAVGVASGLELVASKVETFYVQARTAAGGWSQQRYARRRGNQAAAGVREAVALVSRIVVPHSASLAAVVCGGDRPTVEAIMSDPVLEDLEALRWPRLMDVPEPRHAVLVEAVASAYEVPIHVVP
jgi:Actinobacteria/chloroflexi VLRF1 release factor